MLDPHVVYTPPQVVRSTRLPKGLIYKALDDGRLKAVRRGHRWLIGGAALITFVENLGDQETP